MNWARIREGIGRIWGATTTALLGLGTQIDPLIQNMDPALAAQIPWLKWLIFGLAVGLTVLRFVAPPPPHVSVHIDDDMTVDHDTGTVTITKANGTAGLADKPAGQPS